MASTVTKAIQSRKSIRAFLPRKVPRETLEEMLALASRAASGGNTQPWKVYVLGGEAVKDISDIVLNKMEKGEFPETQEFSIYPKPEDQPEFLARRRKLGFDMFKLLGIEKKDVAGRLEAMKNNFRFFGAPVAMFITVDRTCDRNGWGHVGMFLASFALLARERGLDTCYEEAWSSASDTVYEHVGIDRTKEILWCGMAVGYRDESAKVNTLVSERDPVSKFASFKGFPSSQL